MSIIENVFCQRVRVFLPYDVCVLRIIRITTTSETRLETILQRSPATLYNINRRLSRGLLGIEGSGRERKLPTKQVKGD